MVQSERTTADVVVVTILNMVTVQPAFILLNFLFKRLTIWKKESGNAIEKCKKITGLVLAFAYLSVLISLTINININIPLSESNGIILTTMFSFLNELTVTQLIKSIYQYSLISIIRNDCFRKNSLPYKIVRALINPALLKIFHH